MIKSLSSNKKFRVYCEKQNIIKLKLEEIIYNIIFIESTEFKKSNIKELRKYKVLSEEGIIILTKDKLVKQKDGNSYEITDKSHWNKFKELDFDTIVHHFKNLEIELTIKYEENKLIINYKLNKEKYSKLINSNEGHINIPIKIWKEINRTDRLNTYCHLLMFSNKTVLTKIDFVKQWQEFTGNNTLNIKRTIEQTIKAMNKLGIIIQLEYNTKNNRDRYKNIKVNIEYCSEVQKLIKDSKIKQTKSKVENKQKIENEDVEKYIKSYTEIFNEKPLETVNKKKIENMIETIKELNKINDFNKKVSENIEGIIELMNRYKKAFFAKDSDFRFSLTWSEKQKEKVLTRLMLNKGSWKGEVKAGEVDKDKFDKLNDNTPLADDEVEVF